VTHVLTTKEVETETCQGKQDGKDKSSREHWLQTTKELAVCVVILCFWLWPSCPSCMDGLRCPSCMVGLGCLSYVTLQS
ncbi:hypothetical protein VIGAN_04210700, partial [Vigna angularis var. angularis]